MEQGLLGLSPSKGVLRPSTRFALQTQASQEVRNAPRRVEVSQGITYHYLKKPKINRNLSLGNGTVSNHHHRAPIELSHS